MLDCVTGNQRVKNHSRLQRLGKISARASGKYNYDLEKERIYITIMDSAFESMLIPVLGFS